MLDAALQEQRTLVLSKLEKFRSLQIVFMPSSAIPIAQYKHSFSEDDVSLEIPPVYLPSELPSDLRELLPTQYGLVQKEFRIQVARAEDSLAEICRLLILKSGFLKLKKVNIAGQRDSTRARTVLSNFSLKITRAAERYRSSRASILSLDPTCEEIKHLKVLNPQDIRGAGEDEEEEERRKHGKSRRNAVQSERNHETSWIWVKNRIPKSGEPTILHEG